MVPKISTQSQTGQLEFRFRNVVE